MDLVMPEYLLSYFPTRRFGSRGLFIRVSKEFPDFARSVDINKESLESLGREMYEIHGFSSEMADDLGGVCHWEDGGLLYVVKVPGNAAGISLDLHGIDTPIYSSNNIVEIGQMGVCLAVMTRYLEMVRSFYA